MAEDFMNRLRFNTEITPDRFTLVNLHKKPSESFEEYAHRWRSEVARTQPPLDDNELTKHTRNSSPPPLKMKGVENIKQFHGRISQREKGKMKDTAAAHGMTRSRRFYAPEEVNCGNMSREKN
nr:uncharacterized protein LOC117281909 [Nicotiana tomentosiformis]